MAKRLKTDYAGIFIRTCTHPITKKPDGAFDIRHKEKIDGNWKDIFQVAGYESEGMTAKKASKERQRQAVLRGEGHETPAQAKAKKTQEQTIGEFFDSTVMNHQKIYNKTRVKADGTLYVKAEERFNLHVRPTFGGTRFSDISVKDICDWRDKLQLEKGLAKGTVGIVLNILHQCFRMARDMGVTKYNPFHETTLRGGKTVPRIHIPKPKDNDRQRAFTREEADALIREARNPRPILKEGRNVGGKKVDPNMTDMIIIALKHGLRAGEVAGLQWKDIVFETNQIWLWVQKSGRKESFQMADSVRDIMQMRWSEKEHSPDELVFPAPQSGKKRDTLATPFKAIVDRLGLNEGREHDPAQVVVFHTLRHTFGTWLAQDGVDIKTIQKLMRHASIKDTLRYLNFAPTYSDEVIKRLDSSWAVPVEAGESLPPNVLPMRTAR